VAGLLPESTIGSVPLSGRVSCAACPTTQATIRLVIAENNNAKVNNNATDLILISVLDPYLLTAKTTPLYKHEMVTADWNLLTFTETPSLLPPVIVTIL
jgi:hypothetical protein